MDADRFDHAIRALIGVASRRRLLAGAMFGLVASIPLSWSERGAEAKKGRRRRRRRRQRKGACRGGQKKVDDVCCPPGADITVNDICARSCVSSDDGGCIPGSTCHQGFFRAPGPDPCGTPDNPYCFCGEYVNPRCVELAQPECSGVQHELCGPGRLCDADGCCYTPTFS